MKDLILLKFLFFYFSKAIEKPGKIAIRSPVYGFLSGFPFFFLAGFYSCGLLASTGPVICPVPGFSGQIAGLVPFHNICKMYELTNLTWIVKESSHLAPPILCNNGLVVSLWACILEIFYSLWIILWCTIWASWLIIFFFDLFWKDGGSFLNWVMKLK